eukprot:tig00020531_g10051.t1
MRLKVSQLAKNHHSDIVTAAGWNAANELLTCSDDQTIWRWSAAGEPQAKVMAVEGTYITDMHWFPASKAKQQSGSDVFVVSCTDGTIKLVSRTGRLEKSVEAHKGAAISVRWNLEGTAIASAGEDGSVKIWSRAGIFRSSLAQTDRPVYSVAWGPESDQILFSSGAQLVVKPIQPSSKQLQWKAHDAPVLAADWNPVNNLIVSAGEDCRYKVWDAYGRPLFASGVGEHAVTSVAWAPDGEYFAAGAFDALRLCDRSGWTHSKEACAAGSLLSIAWTPDGTQLAAAGGSGAVVFGQVLERGAAWGTLEARLVEEARLRVTDVAQETSDELDFRDRVVKLALGHGHLVAATAAQCYIYSVANWNTPHIFDTKEPATLIVLAGRHFAMVDGASGVQVYSYEGRVLASVKLPGLRPDLLSPQRLALADDCLAVIDGADPKVVRLVEPASGRALGEVRHGIEVVEVSLSRWGGAGDRKLALVDRNRDLYVTPCGRVQPVKLAGMVDSARWHERTEALALLADGRLRAHFYPSVAYVDRGLLEATRSDVDASEFGKGAHIGSFSGNRLAIRRADGAQLAAQVSPYPGFLYELVERLDWERAVRLCRFARDPMLWALLAAMALNGRELGTAEMAYAAIEHVDKVQYVLHVQEIPSVEGQNAELALLMRRPEEAEAILLQAGLVYRAIMLNVATYNWERALELAVSHKTHVDTVLGHRQRWLRALRREETSKRFQQYAREVPVDWEAIEAKAAQELERERARPAPKGRAQ